MKLYYAPGACSLSPHIVAREAGLAIELERVDLGAKKTASAKDYRQVNPKGYVPALRLDDGAILTEANVVCQFLADRKPESGLAPKPGTMERYRLLEALNFVSSEVHKQIGALFNPAMTDEMKEVQKGTIGRRFNALEQMLEGKQYLCGDTFTIADAYLFTVLNWTGMLQIDTAQWPHIRAYIARVAQRPKVQEAMKEEGLTG